LISADGFLDVSREDRARLMGRLRIDCSASEPESDEDEEDSAGSSTPVFEAAEDERAALEVSRLRGA
jgi:hypothetical protein